MFNQKLVFQFIGNGKLQSGDSFMTHSRSSSYFSVIYYSNSSITDLIAISARCFSADGINLYDSGSFDSSTAFGYYYPVPINNVVNYHCIDS